MKLDFSRLMAQATRLTKRGELQHAVAVIREALGGKAATPPPRPAAPDRDARDNDVIDVEVRELTPAPAPEPEAASVAPVDAPRTPETAEVTDRTEAPDHEPAAPPVARAPAPVREAPAPRAAPTVHAARAERFVAGEYSGPAGHRDYKLYVPPGVHTEPLPLVVMLHGCTQHPDDFAAGTGMNAAALARGFFVLYPAQSQSANLTRCWNWFKPKHQQRDSGEPAVLAGMTREVMARHPIDARRVYVAGLSAGGAMAAILGEAYPDLYAAVGVHSGLPPGAASDMASAFAAMQTGVSSPPRAPAHPTPTIVFHGDQDSTVHPVNGERVLAALTASAVPEASQGRSDQGRAYTRVVYRNADGQPAAEHWVVHGAGHAWSGGQPTGSYTDGTGPDATDAMLRFFFAHTLRTAPELQRS